MLYEILGSSSEAMKKHHEPEVKVRRFFEKKAVGPGRYCSPRHSTPPDSRSKGLQSVGRRGGQHAGGPGHWRSTRRRPPRGSSGSPWWTTSSTTTRGGVAWPTHVYRYTTRLYERCSLLLIICVLYRYTECCVPYDYCAGRAAVYYMHHMFSGELSVLRCGVSCVSSLFRCFEGAAVDGPGPCVRVVRRQRRARGVHDAQPTGPAHQHHQAPREPAAQPALPHPRVLGGAPLSDGAAPHGRPPAGGAAGAAGPLRRGAPQVQRIQGQVLRGKAWWQQPELFGMFAHSVPVNIQ